MSKHAEITIDGNEAAASSAYRLSEVAAIYPITPSSSMGEYADEWAADRRPNIWGTIPEVIEMQSEAGAAGAVHGAVQGGALATTFTASQGLLLMIPDMYKIAGELSAFCMHVAARTISTHALSIFGDHSDVMACRATGFGMLSSGSVQEAHDLACIGHASSMRSRVPFLHFFDGFRTSHEVATIEPLSDDDLRAMVPDDLVAAHRGRALSPDRPVLRGTAQNPDAFFQAREAATPFYVACPGIVREVMERFAEVTGRRYHLFDYVGHPEAERVVVMMGSGAEAAHELVEWAVARGERLGLLKVRLFRPFVVDDFVAALPRTTRAIAVLDRTKEPGAIGDPLYLDVVAALDEARAAGGSALAPVVVGGRYGLSSKEFTPAMVKAVFDELGKERPRRRFTVGIIDDVSGTSLPVDPDFDIEPDETVRAVFFGLGADGTVSANKGSVKILAEEEGRYAQGYFVYDSKKSGAMTISHLRFGPNRIRSSYLIKQATFVACHHWPHLDRFDVLDYAAPGATFLLNAPYPAERVWDELPREVQEAVVAKKLRLYAIDAYELARELGLGSRINTIMQACFFALSKVLPPEQAIKAMKKSIEKTYGRKGEAVIRKNFEAVDHALDRLHEIAVPAGATAERGRPPVVPEAAPDFVKRVTAMLMAGKGDLLPVSAFPVDGTWPVSTARWEKRNIALEIPVWDPPICIQCNKCVMVCPHATIRAKVYAPEALAGAPETFKSVDWKGRDFPGQKYTIQVAPEDCTGCGICVMACPAKSKSNPRHKAIDMAPQIPLREAERANYDFFLALPEVDRAAVKLSDVKTAQLLEPLFEYSGACSGCGETPYLKLLTQLYGDRLIIGNATGCSSIYGGNLPTTPFATNRDGRGPAWSNSLFEDNAEFSFGIRLAVDKLAEEAQSLLRRLGGRLGDAIVDELIRADQASEAGIAAQRARVLELRRRLAGAGGGAEAALARRLEMIADYLVRKSIWAIGGDGWAYDIGYGGLDHILAAKRDVNILVLDTEVYSNTGGQQSKATPLCAAAKFAAAGKAIPKKDLALMAMTYGHVYVARLAFGAKDNQTLKALIEADSYRGPSLIIGYSHCIAHGYDMAQGLEQQKLAVATGSWPLFRFDPRRAAAGENPLELDSAPPKGALGDYMKNETRFRMVEARDPERFRKLREAAEREVRGRYALYEQLAKLDIWAAPKAEGKGGGEKETAAVAASHREKS